jgi:hypothetical protein
MEGFSNYLELMFHVKEEAEIPSSILHHTLIADTVLTARVLRENTPAVKQHLSDRE